MLVNYVALLPEAVLTAGVLLAVLVRFLRSANTAKTFLTLAKWTILPAMMLTAVFYDRNVGGFWSNNDYTTLFKIVIFLFALGWGSLSLRRFQNRENDSFAFYSVLLLELLGFSLMLSVRSLELFAAAAVCCQLLNCLLLRIGADEECLPRLRRHLAVTVFFCLLLAAGVLILRRYGGGGYEELGKFLTDRKSVV